MKTAEISYIRLYSIQSAQVKKILTNTHNIYRKWCTVDFRDGNTILLETEILMGRRKRQEIYNIMFESLNVWPEEFEGFRAGNCCTKRGGI